ncbi:MAG: TolC family protein [Muribaculaceae bacterium]|nr:TolC family protein [Muribaculaceae bacterium]
MNKYSLLLLAVSALLPSPLFAGVENKFTSADSISPEMVTALPVMQKPAAWTFNDCVDWATRNNTDIRRTMLNILTARQDVLSAKDGWLPTVGFTTNQSFTNYPHPENGHNNNTYGSNYNIGASWTVWEGNVRKYRQESAKVVEQQQALAGDDVIKQLKLGILEAYLNILYADEAVKIASQTLEVSTSQAERAKKLMEGGRSSRVEYAQMESQRAQDEYALTQAQSNYETSKMALKKILELGIDYDLKIADISFSDSDVVCPLPNMNEVYNLAAAWLPQLKSNTLNKQIYANDVKIAQAGNKPTIDLQGGIGSGYSSGYSSFGKQLGHNLNENIGVNVNIPIFDANSTKRAVAKAKLAEMEYDLTQKNLLDDLSQTIESLYVDANNAYSKYTAGIAQLEAVKLTDDLVNRQFELGLVNPLDLLTAHNNLLNARLQLLQSKYMAILANKTINYYATQEVVLN